MRDDWIKFLDILGNACSFINLYQLAYYCYKLLTAK